MDKNYRLSDILKNSLISLSKTNSQSWCDAFESILLWCTAVNGVVRSYWYFCLSRWKPTAHNHTLDWHRLARITYAHAYTYKRGHLHERAHGRTSWSASRCTMHRTINARKLRCNAHNEIIRNYSGRTGQYPVVVSLRVNFCIRNVVVWLVGESWLRRI